MMCVESDSVCPDMICPISILSDEMGRRSNLDWDEVLVADTLCAQQVEKWRPECSTEICRRMYYPPPSVRLCLKAVD